jgi:hypothetical protein
MIALLAVLLSAVEVAVLVRWLQLRPAWYSASAVLFVGIAVEELIRFRGVRGAFPKGSALTLVGVGVFVESIGWALAVGTEFPTSLLYLFVFLAVEHAVIRVATNGGTLTVGKVLDFSAIEAFGGAVWLAHPNPGTLAVLAAASLLEHVQGLRQGFGLRG